MPNMIMYGLQGLAVAVAARVIPQQKLEWRDIAMLAASSAITLMVLDRFAPAIGVGARTGAGLAIGKAMI